MNNYLRTLDLLSYTLECITLDYMGEAKESIRDLINRLSESNMYAIDNRDAIVKTLQHALELICDEKIGHGASILGKLNRELWTHVWNNMKE